MPGRPLLERDEPLGALRTAVTDAAARQSSAVLITGEAGIGKTSLVRAFVGEMVSSTRVLAGACDDLHAPRTLGPLRDAVLGTGGPLERAMTEGVMEAVFAAAATELASLPPTVLVIEDMHWADDATLDVLAYLARRLTSLAAVMVLTFREEEARTDHPLRHLLGVLAGCAVRTLTLGPLSPTAVATLATGTGQDPAALHAVTGGNPFHVTEALATPPGDVPPTVTATVLARIQRLSEQCQRALGQLSVVPTQVGFELAEGLLSSGLDTLAEAEERGVLEVHADGIAFRHELARRAIECSLPVIRRRAANRAVVRALLAQNAPDIAQLVHHAAQADDAATVLRYAPQAGRDAGRAGSHRQALAHFEAALRYIDRLPATEQARVLDDYAWELYNAHRYADAVLAGRKAVARYAELNEPVALGESLARLSRETLMAGDADEATKVIDEALRVLEPAGSLPALAYAATCRSALLTATDLSANAAAAVDQARRLATDADRLDLVAFCLAHLAQTGPGLDDDERIQHLRDALEITTTHGFHEHTCGVYAHLADLLYRFGRWEELDGCLDTGLSLASGHGLWGAQNYLEAHRCLLLMRRGQWATAQDGFDKLLRRADDTEALHMLSAASFGRISARRGLPNAEPMVVQAWQRVGGRQRSLLGMAYAGMAYAEWAWLTGRPDQAARVRETWAPHAGHSSAAAFWGELLRYLARAGLPAEPFEGCPEPWAAGLRGDWRAAAAAWKRAGDPYEQALELAESGQAEPTLQALRILDDLDATAAAEIVRRRLKTMGVHRVPRGPRPTTRANPAGLTDRQLDVLALLADGRTNAEIAQALVRSVRTVDHHVAAILTRLGARTRREATDAARALGMITPNGAAGTH